MPAKASQIDAIRRRCGAAMLDMLANQSLNDIDPAAVADAAKAEHGLVRRLFPDRESLVEQGLGDRDEAILLRLAEDFEADPEAGIREKILEGLIARYEDYTPIKEAIRHLSRAAAGNPVLAAMLVHRLNEASKGLLKLAGAGTDGIAGMLRVKGLTGVALSCQRVWLGDASEDLSITIRALDNRLRQAEGLARSLNLLDPGPSGGKDGDDDGGGGQGGSDG